MLIVIGKLIKTSVSYLKTQNNTIIINMFLIPINGLKPVY